MKTPWSEPAFGVAAPFAGGLVQLPERVRVIDDVVEWTDGVAPWEHQGRVDEACLREFVRLAEAPPAAIEAFALRHGPLYLGPDGLPVATADDLPSRIEAGESPSKGASAASGATDSSGTVWYQEPVEGWRAWARYVQTILVLCNALRGAKTGITPDRHLHQASIPLGPPEPMYNDIPSMEERYVAHQRRLSPGLMRRLREAAKGPEDQHAHELYLTVYDRLSPRRLHEWLDTAKCRDRQCTHERCAHRQWENLAVDVNAKLLEVANFTVRLRGTRHNPRVDLEQSADPWFRRTVDSALPTIASQLLASITDQGRTQLCHDCRLPYPVLRRSKHGRCPECRLIARSADAQRSKARRREREAMQGTP